MNNSHTGQLFCVLLIHFFTVLLLADFKAQLVQVIQKMLWRTDTLATILLIRKMNRALKLSVTKVLVFFLLALSYSTFINTLCVVGYPYYVLQSL